MDDALQISRVETCGLFQQSLLRLSLCSLQTLGRLTHLPEQIVYAVGFGDLVVNVDSRPHHTWPCERLRGRHRFSSCFAFWWRTHRFDLQRRRTVQRFQIPRRSRHDDEEKKAKGWDNYARKVCARTAKTLNVEHRSCVGGHSVQNRGDRAMCSYNACTDNGTTVCITMDGTRKNIMPAHLLL